MHVMKRKKCNDNIPFSTIHDKSLGVAIKNKTIVKQTKKRPTAQPMRPPFCHFLRFLNQPVKRRVASSHLVFYHSADSPWQKLKTKYARI